MIQFPPNSLPTNSTMTNLAILQGNQRQTNRMEWMTDLSLQGGPQTVLSGQSASVPPKFTSAPACSVNPSLFSPNAFIDLQTHPLLTTPHLSDDRVMDLTRIFSPMSPSLDAYLHRRKAAERLMESTKRILQEMNSAMESIRPILQEIEQVRRTLDSIRQVEQVAQQARAFQNLIPPFLKRELQRQQDREELKNLPILSTKVMKYDPYCQEELEGYEATFPLLVKKARQKDFCEPNPFTVEELHEREKLIDELEDTYQIMMTFDPDPYTSFFFILVRLYLLAKCGDEGAFFQLIELDVGFMDSEFFCQSRDAWIEQAKAGNLSAKTKMCKVGEALKRLPGSTPGRKRDNYRIQRYQELRADTPDKRDSEIFRRMAREELKQAQNEITEKAVKKRADAIKKQVHRERRDTGELPRLFRKLKRKIPARKAVESGDKTDFVPSPV